ncbi:MAG: NAD-binding protein [Desulfovibrionaceae bacterium]|nr:NAD-binding protein [Desulfovibrionaceae bacterium]
MSLPSSKIAQFFLQHSTRSGVSMILRFFAMLCLLIGVYAALFHYFMLLEGRNYSFVTGLYWIMTVMTTLGFGDITFYSDAGKIFSIVVLVSGILLFLTMLPFMFTQYIYAPWLEAQKKERTPRTYLPSPSGQHVVIVNPSPIALNLADNLKTLGIPYVLLCNDSQHTLDLLDQGYTVIAGEHDSTKAYKNLALDYAAMLVALDTDTRNTNIIFTVRESGANNLKLVASATRDESSEILKMAGCNQVFQFQRLLGEALARRVLNDKARCSIILRVEDLVIAEAPVMRTELVNQTLKDCGLRAKTGVNVVGLWERGQFRLPQANSVFTSTMVMVIAGTLAQIEAVNALLGPKEGRSAKTETPVVILGGGGVGLAAARFLKASGRQYVLVDKEKIKGVPEDAMITGDAADLQVLESANFRKAGSVLITTHDDDTNIYLTLYCRRLQREVQIISRANLDRNIPMLHTAGADLVLSLASMVSNSVINLLSPGKILMINEGLNIFRYTVQGQLIGKQLHGSGIRSETNCSVVALRDTQNEMLINPDPNHIFAANEELFLIGDSKAEKAFHERFKT